MTKENIVKHGVRIPQDMSQTENSNQVSLPVAGGNMVHSYMQSIKSISAISYKKVTYVTLKSCNTSHRCLQLMFRTMLTILPSNKFIDTIKKYFIRFVFCVLLFSMFVGYW